MDDAELKAVMKTIESVLGEAPAPDPAVVAVLLFTEAILAQE